MSTSASTHYTPLESLFLFRGVLAHGLDAEAFARISRLLTNNSFIREGSTYDAARLTSDALKTYFLQLLGDQLRDEARPDGVSPASKKRRLQPPPAPTLRDIRRSHLDKVIVVADRLEEEYRRITIASIREDEAHYTQLHIQISQLEEEERAAQAHKPVAGPSRAPERQDKPKEPRLAAPERTKEPSPAKEQPNVQDVTPQVTSRPQRPAGSPTPGVPVLQPPSLPAISHPTQGPSLPPRPDTTPRAKPLPATHPLGPNAPASSSLSWQPPYQPPRQLMQNLGYNVPPAHRPLQPSPGPVPSPGPPRTPAVFTPTRPGPNQPVMSSPLPGHPALASTGPKSPGKVPSDVSPTRTPSTPNMVPRSDLPLSQARDSGQPRSLAGKLFPNGPPAWPAMPHSPLTQAEAQRLLNKSGQLALARSAIPPHLQPNGQGYRGPSTPTRQSILTNGGTGTKWRSTPTPSTPTRGPILELESPVVEPLSPERGPSLPREPAPPPPQPRPLASAPRRRGRPPRSSQALMSSSPPPKDMPKPLTKDTIKQEESTPRLPTEAGDTTADESVAGKRSKKTTKRKRRESSPTPFPARQETPIEIIPAGPPTEIAWTRAFNKVSGSAMEQIVHHRSANMFAHPIREKDAPGYSKVILQPQDLKSIRAAITHGNKAAMQATAALPEGDPGTSTVRLPISEELVPPRGILNSSQLDRELAHMFSNAVMYNPDPFHGPGPAFLQHTEEDDSDAGDGAGADALGYKVDEFGVVKDARAMFAEVEKLVSELRSAEIQRAKPLLPGASTRHASVGGAGESFSREDEGSAVDEADEQTATEAEGPNVHKRRRTARN